MDVIIMSKLLVKSTDKGFRLISSWIEGIHQQRMMNAMEYKFGVDKSENYCRNWIDFGAELENFTRNKKYSFRIVLNFILWLNQNEVGYKLSTFKFLNFLNRCVTIFLFLKILKQFNFPFQKHQKTSFLLIYENIRQM